MRLRHGLLAWYTSWHWHRWRWLETLWSTLMLLKLWLSTGHRHHLGSTHLHLIVSLPLLHILCLLLLWVSLIIASATHIVVILVLTMLAVHILAAVTLPLLLLLIWLHHGVVGPVSASHLWSSIHHILMWHWHLVVGPVVALVDVHRGRLLWCSRGFELLRRTWHLELRLEFCNSRVQVATKSTQKQFNISVTRN